MNVIISNKCRDMFSSLEVDIIKSMNGEFEVDEIVNTFGNFYFQRMILDITAIKDYKDIKNLQKLSISLNMDRVILVLDESEDATSTSYLSKLISMGIYNFTRNKEGIMYLYNHPNAYRDVAHIHQLEDVTVTVTEKIEDNKIAGINKTSQILGIKNVTDHAGATSLIYMLKKQLEKNYSVVAIEVDKSDFMFLSNNDNMFSVTGKDLAMEVLKHKEKDVVLVDMNNTSDEKIYDDILYLIEPSSIRLTKMMRKDRRIFDRLKGNKIVLNMSLLGSKDILDFEYESKSKVFYTIPPLDDKEPEHKALDVFLTKLGFNKQKTEEKEANNSILGIFNR